MEGRFRQREQTDRGTKGADWSRQEGRLRQREQTDRGAGSRMMEVTSRLIEGRFRQRAD